MTLSPRAVRAVLSYQRALLAWDRCCETERLPSLSQRLFDATVRLESALRSSPKPKPRGKR